MKWSELKIHTTQEAVEPVSNILHEAGASGVAIEDVVELYKERADEHIGIYNYELNPDDYPTEGVMVKAYFPMNSFLGDTVDGIKEAINDLVEHDIDLGHNKITLNEVNEEDWATAWKKYYHAVNISDKITIVPTWEEYTPSVEDEIVIELDPGMAFGTGTHPTTIMSLQALEKYVQPGDHVIDVGTGSGVLSIAAAKLGAGSVFAYDIDDVAVSSARINIKLNKLMDKISIAQNSLLDGITDTVDIVVGNLLAEIIVRFVADAKRVVKPGGYFITSGIIHTKRVEVEDKLLSEGFDIVEVLTMEDWVAIVARS